MNKKRIPSCPNCKSNILVRENTILPEFKIFLCQKCLNGFTHPIPKQMAKYYHNNYWLSNGPLGKIKDLAYLFFQKRRAIWLKKYLSSGKILDIGSGEGLFEKNLSNKYALTCLDFPDAPIKNQKVLKKDFLKWATAEKFDGIVFWESLEHVPKPQKYLEKAHRLLKNNGFIFIECPRFDSFEAKFFKKSWFHLDTPRHLNHLTNTGLTNILNNAKFKVLETKKVYAFEYSVWGFAASLLSNFSLNPTDSVKKGNIFAFLLVLSLILISMIAETVFFLIGNTPIMLVIAKKK